MSTKRRDQRSEVRVQSEKENSELRSLNSELSFVTHRDIISLMNVRHSERGAMDVLIVPIVILSLLFVGVSGFAVWAYLGYTDNRDNVAQKVQDAVSKAQAEQKKTLEAQFTEREKSPYRTYQGPASLGSVQFNYPKTWSGYVDYINGSKPIVLYVHPNLVANPNTKDVKFAVRLELINQPFDQAQQAIKAKVTQGKTKAVPYENSGEKGLRYDGELEEQNIVGSMVMVPLRDKTLKVWTESQEYKGDFDTIILKSLSFVK